MNAKVKNLLAADIVYLKGEKTASSLVGLDEAGRGALAGPVMVGAVWIDTCFMETHKEDSNVLKIQDSKQCSPQQREEALYRIQKWAQEGHLFWTWAAGTVEEIETYNILKATQKAFEKALQQIQSALHDHFKEVAPKIGQEAQVLVDGNALKGFPYSHQNCVQGDQHHFCIAAASIVAKTQRDIYMCQIHANYPQYNFELHKGYGTQQHLQSILQNGPCELHRPSFLKKLLAKSATQQIHINFEE